MKHRQRSAITGAEWSDWNKRAQAATEALRAKAGEGDIDDQIYKGAMPFLLKLFSNKCAYCESIITSTQPGDVEHYRPKGGLRNTDGSKVTYTDDAGQQQPHPGYWWLAYDWENLLPSCIDCNRQRRHGADAQKFGKGELFPVQEYRALKPGEEVNEVPLLINPCLEDPEKHLEYDLDTGLIRGKTAQGAETCQLLGLNKREMLVGLRRDKVHYANSLVRDYMQFVTAPFADPRYPYCAQKLNEIWSGDTDYSAAALHVLEKTRAKLKSLGLTWSLPLPKDQPT